MLRNSNHALQADVCFSGSSCTIRAEPAPTLAPKHRRQSYEKRRPEHKVPKTFALPRLENECSRRYNFGMIECIIRRGATRENTATMTLRKSLFLILCCAAALSACSKKSDDTEQRTEWDRGRVVFIANCVACHNPDPSLDGSIGPAIKGSPKELVESRVLRGTYPPDYKPKRNTKIMPSFPFLEPEIPYLVKYLR